MRFVFVTDELPRPGSAGHLALNHAVLGWLRDGGHEVEIFLVKPRLRLPVERYEFGPVAGPGLAVWGRNVFACAPRDASAILARYALSRLPLRVAAVLRRHGRARKYGQADAILGAFITAEQAAWCAARIEKFKPDAILVDTMFRAEILHQPPLAGLNSVIIAHDVFHLRHRALEAAGYRVYPAGLSRELEAGLLNEARSIAAIQPEEAALIRAMCPDRQVCVAPMPAVPYPRPAGTARLADRLVFAGSATLPNLDGLRWFFAEIWPRLRSWRNTITLDLVGDCAASFASLPEGVNRIGRVPDLAPVLHRASLAISPLRVGSGLKIKLLDYARHGLTTIATPASLQGFAPDDAAPFIAAGEPVSFTVAVADQLRNLDAAGENLALAYVARHYGVATSFAGLAKALALPVKLIA
jgi:succinoglycan biosynthesis protein ExoO